MKALENCSFVKIKYYVRNIILKSIQKLKISLAKTALLLIKKDQQQAGKCYLIKLDKIKEQCLLMELGEQFGAFSLKRPFGL